MYVSDASAGSGRQAWLVQRLARPVTVVWTDNRVAMVSVRRAATGGYRLRLHRMFQQAPDAVWHALVAYMRSADTGARTTLQAYVQRHQHRIGRLRRPRGRPAALCPRGRYFDLEEIYQQLNRTYFRSRVRARITWSRRTRRRQRTTIRLGSYLAAARLIRIHRALDQAFVPRYVVENVVFHEMLHQVIPRRRVKGRWCVHPPEFRQWERRFPAYQRAEAWKRRHLPRLLRG